MHEQALMGQSLFKTSNDQNMLQISKHGNSQSLVLIGVQTS